MGDQEERKDIPPIKFVQTLGSSVTGRHKEKTERIREAMDDLQLVIDGSLAQLTPDSQPIQFSRSVAALARACSIFLRKMVLGDRNEKATRLLDDQVCESMGLRFHKLVKISGKRKPMEFQFGIDRGYVNATKKNEETREPEYTYHVPVGPQKLSITVEFPLPGMVNWVVQPDQQQLGAIRVEELFDLQSEPTLSCNAWLGQQLVLFDGKGISLKEVIRTIVNTEGAHSANVARLNKMVGENRDRGVQEPRLYILNNVIFASVKFNHIVTIESALYLYYMIMDHWLKRGEVEGIYLPVICVVSDSPSKVTSSGQGFLGFEGGLMISLGGQKQLVSHMIRATR